MKHSIALGVLVGLLAATPSEAVGGWMGQDTLHVPLSWCVVQGTPAQANPNIAGDTNTDALIWRRHERPTDNIYVNVSGITFRSAINDVWGTLNFPIIADPDTTVGVQGDVRGEDVNMFGAEYNQLLADCDAAWAALGRAGIGVTAVNANLFHDDVGTYVGVGGWGGCAEAPAGTCVAPYDGRIMVVDNQYLHPTSTNRNFPGSTIQFVLTDSLDQLTGHELGHALSLDHRTNAMALMNPGITDNDADGDGDNFALNAAEITDLRANALNVPGLETDPPGVFNPGRFVSVRQPDTTRDTRAGLDLASVRVSVDREDGMLHLDQQLMAMLDEGDDGTAFYFAVDARDGVGGDLAELDEAAFRGMAVDGVDAVVRATVRGNEVAAVAWVVEDGSWKSLDRDVLGRLHTMVVYPHFFELTKPNQIRPEDVGHPLHQIVNVRVAAAPLGVQIGNTVMVFSVIAREDGAVIDEMGIEDRRRAEFVLEDPSFPHCFPGGEPRPGETVAVAFDNLRPGGIHALIGPTEVARGEVDESGDGSIDLPVPANIRPGAHLVTIGNDGTALTADCVLTVAQPDGEPGDKPGGGAGGTKGKPWIWILIFVVAVCVWWLLRRR